MATSTRRKPLPAEPMTKPVATFRRPSMKFRPLTAADRAFRGTWRRLPHGEAGDDAGHGTLALGWWAHIFPREGIPRELHRIFSTLPHQDAGSAHHVMKAKLSRDEPLRPKRGSSCHWYPPWRLGSTWGTGCCMGMTGWFPTA